MISLLALLLAQWLGPDAPPIQPPPQLPPYVCTGAGCVSRSIAGKMADAPSVKDFCSDTIPADATTCFQNAITQSVSSGARLYCPVGTYTVTGLTITGSLELFGECTVKLANSTSADLLTITGTSTIVRLYGMTFDGNEQNQGFELQLRTINFLSAGTAGSPSIFEVRNCTFLNGTYADIRVRTDGSVTTAESIRISNNTFLAGREGTSQSFDPRYIDLSAPTDFVIEGNVFDHLSLPVALGRAGAVVFDGVGTGAEGRGTITGNTFVKVGRSQLNSSIGAIDLYSRQHSVSVTGNSITTPYGRGINVKSESKAVAIIGNTVEGLSGGTDGTMSAQIVLNASSVSSEANGPFTIAGNSLINSGNDGISVTAKDSAGTVYVKGVLVSGNTVKDANRRGIGIAAGGEVTVSGNIVVGGQIGIYADAVTSLIHVSGNQVKGTSGNAINVSNANTTAYLNITGNTAVAGTRCIQIASGTGGQVAANTCTGQSTSGVDIAGTTAALRVTDNFSDDTTPFVNSGTNTALHLQGNDWTMGSTAHTITLDGSGVGLATMDWHYIDTNGGAGTQTMTNLTGGFDGQVLTLRPLSASHVVTVQNGSNFRLANADFVMDDPKDSITMRWANDAWIEMSRSNNGAANFTYPTLSKPPVTFTGRTADLAAQNLTPSATAGDYRVCVTARTTTSGTGTTANLNIIWTDEGGVKTDAVGTWALNSVTVTGQINKCEFIHAAAATAIQYSVTAGTYGTSVYAISGTLERLN